MDKCNFTSLSKGYGKGGAQIFIKFNSRFSLLLFYSTMLSNSPAMDTSHNIKNGISSFSEANRLQTAPAKTYRILMENLP